MAHRPASRWLVRSSALAISFGCLAMAAMDRGSAQSFQGTANVVAGQVDSLTTGTGTTDILINGATPQVVIDWTPTDTSAGGTPIAFQNSGTTTTFSQDGGGNFAVLNRILPTGAASGRAVLLNGNIRGQVGISVPQPGGTIYFYTPNGLVIGSNAQIDVGRLGLTTSSPQITTGFSGGFITGTGTDTVVLTGANAGSYVSVQPNAQINALVDTSSYVAIFAPTILQGGTINVDGSTALIAAEAGTMIWSNGLFDVAVTTGTDGDGTNQAIFHTGSTGGPASGGAGDFHRIYTVAVPKNTAITTLIASGSSLGFDVAGAADTLGNAVILTGGYDLVGGSPSLSSGAGSGTASVRVTNSTVTSSLSLHATDFGVVEAVAGGSSSLASGLYIRGPLTAQVGASSPASTLSIAGDVILDATRSLGSGAASGGNSFLMATGGGTLTVGGSAILDSSALTGAGGTATGGLARVLVDGGSSLTVGNDLSLASRGTISQTQTGNGFGGTAEVIITESGSTATINGDIDIDTAGQGGGLFADLTTGEAGGNGTGGTSRILLTTGPNTLNVSGNVNVEANGRGGDGNLAASGNGAGGTAIISAAAGGSVTIQGDVDVEAAGTSGSVAFGFGSVVALATSGGNASGGIASVGASGTGSIVSVGADLTIDVSAVSDGTSLSGAAGGVANGGIASIDAAGGSVSVGGVTDVFGTARGGSGASSNVGMGGIVSANANNAGSLTFHGLNLYADGRGAVELADSVTGNGQGGSARLTAIDGSAIGLNGSLLLSANGTGGDADASFGLLIAGSGTGGVAELTASNTATVTIPGIATIRANGVGTDAATLSAGDIISGGLGDGGLARLTQLEAATIQIGQGLDLQATARAGSGLGSQGVANGGIAQGGSVEVTVGGVGSSGSLIVNGSVSADVSAIGGDASAGGSAGYGVGGDATIGTVGGSAFIQAGGADTGFDIDASGDGGDASGTGTGGDGRGGSAILAAIGGNIDVVSVIGVLAGGNGGASVGGNAGAGYGGVAQITSDAGAVVTLTPNDPAFPLLIDSSGAGGSASGSGNGGDGSGGQAAIATFAGGQVDVVGDLLISAISSGGDGANGGAGNGILNPVTNNVAFAGLSANAGGINVSGVTQLQASSSGGAASGPGGAGGSASGGFASVFSNGLGASANIELDTVDANASAIGGDGGIGGESSVGGVGGSAAAGIVSLLGTADDGDLVTAEVTALAFAAGGRGGDGGGDPLGGDNVGAGGAGGSAVGGALLIGLVEGSVPGAGGTATFGNVTALMQAQGGAGGDGAAGLTITAAGGAGGAAVAAARGTAPAAFSIDGPTEIRAVGGSATIGDFLLAADATGGNGGAGGVAGQGGSATSGGFNIVAKHSPASGQRGDLTVGNVFVDLDSLPAGTGASLYGSGPRVTLENSDASFLSLSILKGGVTPSLSPASQPAELFVLDGTLTATVVDILTPGAMSVFLEFGQVVADFIRLDAGDFIDNGMIGPGTPGLLDADSVDIISNGNIILDAGIRSVSGISLSSSSGIRTFDLISQGEVFAFAGGSVQVRDVSAATDIGITAGIGALTFRNLQAGQDVDLIAGDSIVGNAIDAGDSVVAQADDAINLGGGITAGIVNPFGGTGAAYSVGLLASNAINVGSGISANGQIGIGTLNGSVSGGSLNAASDILILARSSVAINAVDAANGVVYIADSSMFALSPSIDPFDPAPILASAPVAMAGPIGVGNVFGTRVTMATSGDVTLGEVFAPDRIFIRGNNVFGVDFTAGNSIRLESAGLMSILSASTDTGNIDLLSGGTVAANKIDAAGSVAVQAAQDIALFSDETDTDVVPAAISAGGTVRLVAQAGSIFDITSARPSGPSTPPQASIAAGGTILALAGDSVALRSLTSSTGGVYIANSSMAQFGGSFDNFNVGAVISQPFAPVAGSVLLSGNVSSPFGVRATSSGPMSVQGISAGQFFDLRSGGLLSVGGIATAINIGTQASDIAIGATGRLQATGLLSLISTNSAGMWIGDTGLTGGYQISAAEFARLSGGRVNIIGPDIAGQAIDMVIGSLAVTGPLAGSTVETSNGFLRFITGNGSTQTPSGGIRITGSLAARGFTPTNQLGFFTETLQLDANTGLIEVLGQGTQLSGELVIGAPRFHAAELATLDRLLANPLYSGRAADINTPLATPRPSGIVRASDIDTDASSQILIQNTGTRELPAGFFVFSEGPLERDDIPPQGTIDFIVNGQLLTDAGQLAGAAVFDHLVSADNRPFFTPESTVNGCLVSGTACTLEQPEPDVREMDAEFLPSDSITHFTQEPATEPQAINPEEREEAEEEAKRAPIPPPTPIISTQPLAPVIDVDEPVAGAGNPGLISTVPTPAGQGRETAQ